jgi:LPXTG-motif cell wall-anchored protein
MVTFVGSLIRGFLLGLLGWYVGSAYVKYAQTIAQVEKYVLVIVGVVCLLLVGWFVHKRRKKKATQGGKR